MKTPTELDCLALVNASRQTHELTSKRREEKIRRAIAKKRKGRKRK